VEAAVVRIGRRRQNRAEHEGAWHRIATLVIRRPIPIATVVVMFFVLLGAPFLRASFGTPDDRVLSTSAGSHQASEILRAEFSGNAAESFGVVADGVGADRLDDIAAGRFLKGQFTSSGSNDGGFLASDGTVISWMSVVPDFPVASPQGERLVKDIRSVELHFEVAVEGQAAGLVDSKAAIGGALPWAIAIIFIATFGAMVWIFQDGNLSELLGFTATGTLNISMPILMFCIAFGLSMDYEVFLLSRIKEEYDRFGLKEGTSH